MNFTESGRYNNDCGSESKVAEQCKDGIVICSNAKRKFKSAIME